MRRPHDCPRPSAAPLHHCGLTREVPSLCPRCRSSDVIRQGTGTQGLEDALTKVPGAPIIRLDADVTARRGELEARLARLPAPTGRPLRDADGGEGTRPPRRHGRGRAGCRRPLQRPDFRAEERAFQLIVQLAGRAGRRGEPAAVFVQAWEPGGRAVQLGARHDVTAFMDGEVARRREHGFPPFGHLVRVLVVGLDPAEVTQIAARLVGDHESALPFARVLGPAVLHRVRQRTRRAVLVRAERAQEIAQPVRAVADALLDGHGGTGVRIVVDVDPQDT